MRRADESMLEIEIPGQLGEAPCCIYIYNGDYYNDTIWWKGRPMNKLYDRFSAATKLIKEKDFSLDA